MTVKPGIRFGFAACLLAAALALIADPLPPVSRADAEKAALKKVPGGHIIDGELENEAGHLIWSFDIAQGAATKIIEVHVDATVGKILSPKAPSNRAVCGQIWGRLRTRGAADNSNSPLRASGLWQPIYSRSPTRQQLQSIEVEPVRRRDNDLAIDDAILWQTLEEGVV